MGFQESKWNSPKSVNSGASRSLCIGKDKSKSRVCLSSVMMEVQRNPPALGRLTVLELMPFEEFGVISGVDWLGTVRASSQISLDEGSLYS